MLNVTLKVNETSKYHRKIRNVMTRYAMQYNNEEMHTSIVNKCEEAQFS